MTPSIPAATLDTSVLLQMSADLYDRLRWPRQELLSFQSAKLKATLSAAAASCPYYRKAFGGLVENDRPLREFPTLTKRCLMENFGDIVGDSRLSRQVVERHLDGASPGSLIFGEFTAAATGGTTGERGIAVFDQPAWLAAIANTVRFQQMVEIGETTRSMGIFASSPVHISYRIGAEIRAIRSPAPRLNVLMPIQDIVATLNEYQPEVVSTYPSFVRVLAEEQVAGRLQIAPRFIRTSAEALTQETRDVAAATWQATVLNSYTCTEAGSMGHECEYADGLHLAEDAFVFEVVDADNQPVQNGTRGSKLLVTTLTNHLLPLIRYEISDMVTMATEPCKCGLPLWRIAAIDGRREELLHFARPDGTIAEVHAHRLRSPLTRTEGVRQFQFAELQNGLQVIISVFPDVDVDRVARKIELGVRATLEAINAQPEAIVVNVVDAIERSGPGAKERLVATTRGSQ